MTEPKIQTIRGSHKVRIVVILVLMAIVAAMFLFFEKFRIALVVLFVALLAALGLEASQNDWDLEKLWETKSFQESKVSRDETGNLLFDKLGNVTTDSTVGKKSDEYNCDDFLTQPDAQSFFNKVGGAGNDLNRLDGDKDGQACESLPGGN
jgi:hypothetical protein